MTLNPYFQRAEDKRTRLLSYIDTYIKMHGYPPTMREMAKFLSTCIGGIQFHLNKMRKDRLLTWEYNKPRTLKLLQPVGA